MVAALNTKRKLTALIHRKYSTPEQCTTED